MSAKKRFTKPMRADELLAQLQRDPSYMQMMREKDEQSARNRAEFEALERPVLEDLRQIEIAVSSVGDASFFKEYLPLPRKCIDVLLRWVPQAHPRVQECLVRLLAAAGAPFDGRVLTDLFDRTESSHLRWVIANTLEVVRPSGISEWLEQQLLKGPVGDSARPLFNALVHVCERDVVLRVSRRLLEALPGAVAPVLGKHGTTDDLAMLEKMVDREDASVQRKLKSAISKIRQRACGTKNGGKCHPFLCGKLRSLGRIVSPGLRKK